MPKLTQKDIAHVATLARLRIEESDFAKRLAEFNDILTHIEKLNEIDTNQIEPTAQITTAEGSLGTPLAPDQPVPSLDPDVGLANAPSKQDHYFRVPRVVENE